MPIMTRKYLNSDMTLIWKTTLKIPINSLIFLINIKIFYSYFQRRIIKITVNYMLFVQFVPPNSLLDVKPLECVGRALSLLGPVSFTKLAASNTVISNCPLLIKKPSLIIQINYLSMSSSISLADDLREDEALCLRELTRIDGGIKEFRVNISIKI
ncbi:hypothetical protein BpHYR1_025082 [Brachionus plicatilis]|uniref:Uncharacterized protein n=1 Tax=Brachionus plicatilis TaxID=10195 RepID=A0A3M7RGE8_BRAPC|nr:hypothetical protein BpHYR1_025082 [Brachionus plicatilis]